MTPALDALLKEVEAANAVSVERDPADSAWEYDRKVMAVLDRLACAAPRLAAMLRVAVEALKEITNSDCYSDAVALKMTSLARIERIAAGESGPPEGQAMAKGE